MSYTPVFEKPYPNGYKDKPIKTTPITASTLNDKDAALEHIEDYLETNPIIDVEANPVLSGTEEALESIKIGNEKYKIEGGGASTEIIANDYDAEKTYNEGEYCAYNNTIWKSLSISEGETPEEGEYWTEVVVMDEVEIAMNSGGSANIWEGSHAEYEEEKSQIPDETTLLFNDDIGLEAESDYYSEVEQVIGTYMGKPLYRRILTGNIASGQNSTTLNVSNINVVVFKGYAQLTTGNKVYNGYSSASAYFNLHYNETESKYLLYHPSTFDGTYYVVLEYTKTTDSVVGVVGGIKKGDNYSTTEQVIGTWIDGQILYKRTFVVDNPIAGLNYLNVNERLYPVNIYGGFISKTSYNLWSLFSRTYDNAFRLSVASFGYDSTGTYVECEIGTNRTNVSKLVLTIEYVKDV